jgi:dTDP-4-dehydrorhamnose reductase
MRVLILGAAGMLGHKLYQRCQHRFETWATVRTSYPPYSRYRLFNPERIVGGVDAFNMDAVIRALGYVRPHVVVNCIGVVKQLPTAKDPIVSLTINSLFPHRVAATCRAMGTRFIHISTDCVFKGDRGMYTEDDPPDPEDLYGQTKALGEVDEPGSLTLRTSMIGRELNSSIGLVEWFLSQRPGRTGQPGHVRGFRKAIYSGFTTQSLADIIAEVIKNHPGLTGLYHVASEPINKYDLLVMLRDAYRTEIEIEPYDEIQIDRSLDGSRFQAETGHEPPSWPEMIQALAEDSTPYDEWRSHSS